MDEKGVENINTVNIKVDLVTSGTKIFLGLILILFNSKIGGYLYKQNVVE